MFAVCFVLCLELWGEHRLQVDSVLCWRLFVLMPRVHRGQNRSTRDKGVLLFLCDWPLDFLVNISHMGDFLGRSQSQSKRSRFLLPICGPWGQTSHRHKTKQHKRCTPPHLLHLVLRTLQNLCDDVMEKVVSQVYNYMQIIKFTQFWESI